MKMYVIILSAALLIISGPSFAAGYSSTGILTLIRMGTDGDVIVKHSASLHNPESCSGTNGEYRVSSSLAYFESLYSMLLASYMAEELIKIYIDGCENNYPRIISARLNK